MPPDGTSAIRITADTEENKLHRIRIAYARAANGARLLDRHKPGWAKEISFDGFSINSKLECVLGQLYGNYEDGLVAIGLPEAQMVEHGFALKDYPTRTFPGFGGNPDLEPDHEELRDAWQEHCLERQKAKRSG